MDFVVDTHTHSLVSGHAFSTIREMALAASQQGMEALAVTEHGPEMPGSVGEIYFINYFKAPTEMYGVKMLYGAELNILDATGRVDLSEKTCREFLDVVIASVHTNCFDRNCTVEALMSAYIGAMNTPYIQIIGHPDDGRYPVDYKVLVEEAAKTGTMLELNEASLRPRIARTHTRENMITIMDLCKEYGVYVTLGSDAHADCDVGDFRELRKLIEERQFPLELIANTDMEKFMRLLKRKG